jgi:CheY-like chemotaxis protein
LLVEDEELVRNLARTILEESVYRILEARDGQEALSICEQHGDPIHLLLTDMVMPHMSGHELCKRCQPLRPGMRVLFMSGYTDAGIVHHGGLDDDVAFLQKPFTPDTLLCKVRDVLDATEIDTSS